MEETEIYLQRVAFAEVFGRQVKEDDVQAILTRKANVEGSWITRKLAEPNSSFVACPSTRDVVHQLMTGSRIRGNDFSLQVNHWDTFKGGASNQLNFKVSASLLNLPLACWNSHAVAMIVLSFGLPHRASKSCLKWENLASFDLDFFCDDIDEIPESVSVNVGPHVFNVQIRINFISERTPPDSHSIEDSSGGEGKDWDYWFGSGDRHPPPPENMTRPADDAEGSNLPGCRLLDHELIVVLNSVWNLLTRTYNPSLYLNPNSTQIMTVGLKTSCGTISSGQPHGLNLVHSYFSFLLAGRWVE
ncbi:hypothetical protein COCNU_05G004750 [Cocos nucifera]|uniref:DUF4283 domain-containing protein n=1 Tax=Cocos nucifera TaxID=13894 RepID=A0A8K0I985_COCNU|nr:hypothetical protein COCNU_05G004750 [Cocos nucifera]